MELSSGVACACLVVFVPPLINKKLPPNHPVGRAKALFRRIMPGGREARANVELSGGQRRSREYVNTALSSDSTRELVGLEERSDDKV